jgi:hypothetical protein
VSECESLASDRCISNCPECCTNAGATDGICIEAPSSDQLGCECFFPSTDISVLPASTECGDRDCVQGEYCRYSDCGGPPPEPGDPPCVSGPVECREVPERCWGHPELCECIVNANACGAAAVGSEVCEVPCP